ncbi:hypothetical protein QUF90_22545 [Desulfococcaceae bacterium HSG9]|nr:hypothetical protein [Desulfococcaceae bacterium HSG9]
MDDSKNFDEKVLKLKKALQTFQSRRLNTTYHDLRQKPEYKNIAYFFFQKLYGPEDYEFRNTSMQTLHKAMDGRAPGGMIDAVSMVIELHDLSDDLDNRMVEAMIASGVETDMNMAQYQSIYRQLDNYDERIGQIELSLKVTRVFYALSRRWVVRLSLGTIRRVAHLLGIGKIMDFVYEGYTAFRVIHNIDYFIETIEKREKAWHSEIMKDAN